MAEDKLVDKPQDTSIPTNQPKAVELLSKFLQDNNIELRLTPPMVRQVEAGGIMIDQPQIVADYKKVNSIVN